MFAAEIFFKDWRNISEINFRPDAAINIFLGRNAQGKTNILEAINFASLLRSRAGKDSELIRWGKTAALIRIKFFKAGVSHELAIEISERRRIFLDANPIRPRELVGKLNSVFFFARRFIFVQRFTRCPKKIFGRANFAGVADLFLGLAQVQSNRRTEKYFAEKNS